MMLSHTFLCRAVLCTACIVLPLVNASETTAQTGLVKLGTDALVAVSVTGKSLAAWSPRNPGSVRFVFTETGSRGAELPLPPDTELLSLDFRAKDGFLSAVTADGRLLTWAGTEPPEAIELEGGVSGKGAFELSRSATTLAYGGTPDDEGSIGLVWDLQTGERKHSFEGKTAIYAAVSPDDRYVFLVAPDSIRRWDSGSGKELQLERFSPPIESVKKSADGRYLLCVTKYRVWLVDTVEGTLDYIEGSEGVRAAFSPSGDRVVVGQGAERDRIIEVWSLGAGLSELAFEKEYRGRRADPLGVAGSAIVYHGHSSGDSLVIEEFAGGQPTPVAQGSGLLKQTSSRYDSSVTLIETTESGNRVALGLADGTLGMWTTAAKINGFAPVRSQRDPRVPMARRGSRCLGVLSLPSPPTEARFIGDQGSMLVDLIDGDSYLAVGPVLFPASSVATLNYRPWDSGSGKKLNHVDFSPDGKLLAVALDDGLSIVNTAGGTEREFYPQGCFVARFSSRGDKVFCVGTRQHGMADLSRRTYVPMSNFGAATGRLSGARLITKFSTDKRAVLAEADTGRVVNYFKGDLIARPMQYGVSENGEYFIIAGSGRSRNIHLEVFGVEEGRLLVSMESDNSGLIACHVLSDGQTAVIGSQQGAALYDMRRRRFLRSIPDSRHRDEDPRRQGYLGSVTTRGTSDPKVDATFMFRGKEFSATAMDINEAAGRLLLAEHSRVTIWDLNTGALVWLGDFDDGRVESAALSPDGQVVAIGKSTGVLHIQRINR